MTRLADAPRPLPHLDEPVLRRAWSDEALVVGAVVDVEGRRYRVLGCDPAARRPRRVYLEALESGRRHALVVRNRIL